MREALEEILDGNPQFLESPQLPPTVSISPEQNASTQDLPSTPTAPSRKPSLDEMISEARDKVSMDNHGPEGKSSER